MARLLLEPRPGAAVLDIACGTGAFTRDFAAAVGPDGFVVGLDGSPTMLARAVGDTSSPTPPTCAGDAERLPFRRRPSTPSAASPPCICSPTPGRRLTR